METGQHIKHNLSEGLPDAARDSPGGNPHFYNSSPEGTPHSMWFRVARTQVGSLSVCLVVVEDRLKGCESNREKKRQIPEKGDPTRREALKSSYKFPSRLCLPPILNAQGGHRGPQQKAQLERQQD